MKKRSVYTIALLFVMALALRIPGTGRPLIIDERKAIGYASASFKDLTDKLILDSQPPFYYCVLKLWSFICRDTIFLRLLTVFLGAAVCIILYAIAKRTYGEKAAYYAFILAALSPQLIFQSQHLRPYCIGTLLSAVLVYLFIRFMDTDDDTVSIYHFIVLSAMTTLCMYSIYISAFIIAALNIFALRVFIKNRPKLLIWFGSQIVAVLLFSFWLPVLLAQKYLIDKGITCHLLDINNARIGFYVGSIHAGNILRVIGAYFHFDDIAGQAFKYSAHIKHNGLLIWLALALAITACIFAFAIIKIMLKTEKIKGASVLLLLLITVPALSFIAMSIGGDLGMSSHVAINTRYFSQSSIYVLVLVAVFLAGMKKRFVSNALLSCVAALFIMLDMHIYQYPNNISKPALEYLLNTDRDCRVIILGSPKAKESFDSLFGEKFSGYLISGYDGRSKSIKQTEETLEETDKVYFYYFKAAETVVFFPDLDVKFEKLACRAGFKKIEENRISDTLIISYFEK